MIRNRCLEPADPNLNRKSMTTYSENLDQTDISPFWTSASSSERQETTSHHRELLEGLNGTPRKIISNDILSTQ